MNAQTNKSRDKSSSFSQPEQLNTYSFVSNWNKLKDIAQGQCSGVISTSVSEKHQFLIYLLPFPILSQSKYLLLT